MTEILSLSERVTQLPESQTIKMAQLCRDLKAEGADVIDLSLGEPDFGTPQHIRDAAKKAIDEGYSHYPPVPGYPDLRSAIAQKLKRDNNLTFEPNQIVVSTGAKQSLANILFSLVNPGDEVIIPSPYWVTYSAQVQMVRAQMVNIQATIDADFKITPQQLEEAITEKTKAFLFSSPCNPTGSVYTHDELAALAEVFRNHPDIFIISDEIYEYIVFEGRHESLSQFDFLHDRVIIVNGLSKAYAMTGWRLGWMAAPLEIAKACSKIQGQFTSGASTISQRAAIDAILGEQGPTLEMCDQFRKRCDMMIDLIGNIPGFVVNIPKGAFYLFPNVSQLFGKSFRGNIIRDADDLCMMLLKKSFVSVVTGKAFGNGNCIRISYANSEENLREAAKRIGAFCG